MAKKVETERLITRTYAEDLETEVDDGIKRMQNLLKQVRKWHKKFDKRYDPESQNEPPTRPLRMTHYDWVYLVRHILWAVESQIDLWVYTTSDSDQVSRCCIHFEELFEEI